MVTKAGKLRSVTAFYVTMIISTEIFPIFGEIYTGLLDLPSSGLKT